MARWIIGNDEIIADECERLKCPFLTRSNWGVAFGMCQKMTKENFITRIPENCYYEEEMKVYYVKKKLKS